MEEQVLDFIKCRFPMDCGWTNGNCYFFAKILESRFIGDVVYDPIDGHFLFYGCDDKFYDWTGRREYTQEQIDKMVLWKTYSFKDSLHYSHVYRDCVK